MKGREYGISAAVSIRAPLGDPVMPAEITDQDLGRVLRRVTICNSIFQPAGTFEIELTPTPGGTFDQNLAEIISDRSLVQIAPHRYSPNASDPASTQEPEVCMLGLVDDVCTREDYGSKEIQRRVTITGRALSALLVDHKWWFHHLLATDGQLGDVPEDIRAFSRVKIVDAALRDETDLRALGFLAINDRLFDPAARDPVSLISAAFDFFIRGYIAPQDGQRRPPFVKLEFADKVPLSSRLQFDDVGARSAFFDPAARLIQKFLPNEMPRASCWDLVRYFAEERFTELYSDSFGVPTLSGGAIASSSSPIGACSVIVRKPPFRGHIAYEGTQANLAFSGLETGTESVSDTSGVGQSLFDDSFGSWRKTEQTVYVDGLDIIGRPRLSRGLSNTDGESHVYSLYNVLPKTFGPNIGRGVGQIAWQQLIPPIIEEDPGSPSYIRRIGLRPCEQKTQYIAVLLDDDQTPRAVGDIRRQCLAYEALLREWQYRNPRLWFGTYSLKGRTTFRAGRRLVDLTRPREFYITGVRHELKFGERPSFVSHVTVARGWDLAEADLRGLLLSGQT